MTMTCSACGCLIVVTEEEDRAAMAEALAEHEGLTPADMKVVCDECFPFMESVN